MISHVLIRMKMIQLTYVDSIVLPIYTERILLHILLLY
jgi:hypothetical protein